MGLILCPECGAKISDKALTCPHCGYVSNDKNLPISLQDKYESIPIFKYEINEWNPQPVSLEDNKKFFEYFGNWENIQYKMPALAETIKAMATKDNYMIAKIPEYIKKMIKDGTYKFSIDKSGEILPTINNGNGIVKQVRLENMSFNPQLGQSLVNLSNQMAMAKISAEIQYVGKAICLVHDELQNDRLALVDSSFNQLKQAILIEDSHLRKMAIINVINKATEAKCILMRNYELNYNSLAKEKEKNFLGHIFSKDDSENKAKDAMKDIIGITNAVQVECAGYSALGEFGAEKECLLQFKKFIDTNKLTKRDTLLTINGAFTMKNIDFVNQFVDISKKISNYEDKDCITLEKAHFLMGSEDKNE